MSLWKVKLAKILKSILPKLQKPSKLPQLNPFENGVNPPNADNSLKLSNPQKRLGNDPNLVYEST